MAKFLLGIAIVLFCSFCGFYLAKKYRIRQSFYTQLWEFNERFLGEIAYYRRPLGEFLSKYTYKNQFELFINSFYSCLKKEGNLRDLAYPDFMNEDERREVFDYFSMLGKGDSGAQKAYFTSVKETLSRRKKESVDACKKYGDLYVKLGFLIGLFILVLIV